MYLIPGCVRRGVKLGSESLSGAAAGAGGACKSGNLEIWESGALGTWQSGDLQIQKCGVKKKLNKFSKLKSMLLKMYARSRFVCKSPPGTISLHFMQFLHGLQKTEKKQVYFPWWALVTRFGPLLLSTLGGCKICQSQKKV